MLIPRQLHPGKSQSSMRSSAPGWCLQCISASRSLISLRLTTDLVDPQLSRIHASVSLFWHPPTPPHFLSFFPLYFVLIVPLILELRVLVLEIRTWSTGWIKWVPKNSSRGSGLGEEGNVLHWPHGSSSFSCMGSPNTGSPPSMGMVYLCQTPAAIHKSPYLLFLLQLYSLFSISPSSSNLLMGKQLDVKPWFKNWKQWFIPRGRSALLRLQAPCGHPLKILSSVSPKSSFGRHRRMSPYIPGPERAFQDVFFLIVSS